MTMPNNPKVVRLRGRSLKINVTEDDLKTFVGLCTETTAYMLSVTRKIEMPDLETIKQSLMPAKIWLAKKFSQRLNEIIEPAHIANLSLELITFGGYAKVEFVVRKTVNGVVHVQTFKVSLCDETQTPLIMKFSQTHPNMGPLELADKMLDL